MEYSESIITGPELTHCQCPKCGHIGAQSRGLLHYAYFFLEYLPVFPTRKEVRVTCSSCYAVIDNAKLSDSDVKSLQKRLFSPLIVLPRYFGAFLILLIAMLLVSQYAKHQSAVDEIVMSPKVNDFVLLDYRKLTSIRRPGENYMLAKVVDITGDIVSLSYSNFYFAVSRQAQNDIRRGRTGYFDYFSRKRYDFTMDEYRQLRETDAIVEAFRPQNFMLLGQIVVKPRALPKADPLIPGSIENVKGMAYQDFSYVDGNLEKAFEYLTISADKGYRYGQFNLANLLLTHNTDDATKRRALQWYEKAAVQGMQQAIDKYLSICATLDDCSESDFYRQLQINGVNFTFR